MRTATIAELEDWEQGGAVWEPVEVTAEEAIVDLCSCSGEPMDRVRSEEREFIEFVRSHRPS